MSEPVFVDTWGWLALTSVAIMRRRGITRVLSGDADFARVGLGLELLPRP